MMRKGKSIWKSKKGGIPVINEVVLTILNTTPKPILFLLFLFLISLIGTVAMPSLLNLFGYECLQTNHGIALYQVPMANFLEKTAIDLRQNVRSFFGLSDYQLPQDPFPSGDTNFVRIPAECLNEVTINGSSVVGYSSACVNCTYSNYFLGRYIGSVCLSDGYYDPTIITRYWVGTANFCYKCAPPNPYFFNYSRCVTKENCFFQITDPSLAGSIITTDYESNYYYQQIIKLGGQERPQDTTQFVNVQCEDVNKPQLYFFSIKIFDLQLWIYLSVAYVLIIFAWFWYKMIGVN